MSEEIELICTQCPNGCKMQAVYDKDQLIAISGNQCPRGKTYAEQEIRDPKRILTAIVRTTVGPLVIVPIRTSIAISRTKFIPVLQALDAFTLDHTVACGDTIIENIADTGSAIIVTRENQ